MRLKTGGVQLVQLPGKLAKCGAFPPGGYMSGESKTQLGGPVRLKGVKAKYEVLGLILQLNI